MLIFWGVSHPYPSMVLIFGSYYITFSWNGMWKSERNKFWTVQSCNVPKHKARHASVTLIEQMWTACTWLLEETTKAANTKPNLWAYGCSSFVGVMESWFSSKKEPVSLFRERTLILVYFMSHKSSQSDIACRTTDPLLGRWATGRWRRPRGYCCRTPPVLRCICDAAHGCRVPYSHPKSSSLYSRYIHNQMDTCTAPHEVDLRSEPSPTYLKYAPP